MYETLAEQPKTRQYERFDRYERTYNDTTTMFAEMLNGSMRTPFEYIAKNGDLLASDGSSMSKVFADAEARAEDLARQNPTLAFELRRCRHESAELADMLAMTRGDIPDTMVVVSDFPTELGGSRNYAGGYNVTRKQTMLRVLAWDGSRLKMYTQSLDRSDRKALENIYASLGYEAQAGELLGQRMYLELDTIEQEFLVDRLTGVYDRAMTAQYGGEWYAGRRERPRDTYQFACAQTDLVSRYVSLELAGQLTENEKFNIVALLNKRYEDGKHAPVELATQYAFRPDMIAMQALQMQNLEYQLLAAGNSARREGRVFSGCGMSISGGKTEAESGYDAGGYGEKSTLGKDEDQYGSLTFTCPDGHTNRRPRGKLLSACQTRGCKAKVTC